MGYRIVYGPEPAASKQKPPSLLRFQTLTAAFFLLFALVVSLAWPEGTEKLRSYLIPGDLSVTEQAFSDLTEDLRQGEPFEDALTTFCAQIISEGQVLED